MAAATGRLSSDHPNLQNIPVRSETGRLVRRAFVPRDGWTFLVADYSQIELRILAHMSEDAGLLSAFLDEDRDIHTATAASVFGLDDGDVTPDVRRRAKAINFGLLYGMEAFGLADRLGISRDEAKEHMDAYFATFPSVKAYMDTIVDEAKASGYTETLFGRRRYLPELRSDRWQVRQMGERMALNAPIQGTAADVIKLAMLAVDGIATEQGGALLLQIHDELVLEIPDEGRDRLEAAVVAAMEGVADLRVPLSVSTGHGPSLADVKA
jgi:DNA polymerase-1